MTNRNEVCNLFFFFFFFFFGCDHRWRTNGKNEFEFEFRGKHCIAFSQGLFQLIRPKNRQIGGEKNYKIRN